MNKEKLESAKKLFFIALGLDIAVTALAVISDFWGAGVLKDIGAGQITADQSTISTLEFWDSFAKLMIVTMLGVGLALVKWLNTCYSYAKEVIGASGFKNEGWTAGGWIIPIFNLFKPYQVINEIYKASSPTYALPDGWKKEGASGLLLAWWIFWALTHFIGWIVGKQMFKSAMRDDMTLQQSIGAIEFHAWFCVVFLVVSGLWLIVANHLTGRLFSRQGLGNNGVGKSVTNPASLNMGNFNAAMQSTDSSPIGAVISQTTSRPQAHPAFTTPVSERQMQAPQHAPNAITELSNEEDHWATAMAELETGQRRPGLWGKAFAESEGDETKAKVAYLKSRVQQLTEATQSIVAEKESKRREAAAKEHAEAIERQKNLDALQHEFVAERTFNPDQLKVLVRDSDDKNRKLLWNRMTGNTLLHACAACNLVEEVHVLLQAGADPQLSNNKGQRPEFMTTHPVIKKLLSGPPVTESQLKIMLRPPVGLCPNCDEPMEVSAEICPSCGANVGPQSNWTIQLLSHNEMLKKLKAKFSSEKKATVNQVKYLTASVFEDRSLVSLINRGLSDRATLLHWCAHFSLIEEAESLLANGADARAETSKGQLPYQWCKDAELHGLLEAAAQQ